MKTPLYKQVNATRPAAVMALSNTFGAAIWNIAGDECVAAWSNGESYHGAHRHMIHYSTAGRPFIRKGSLRLYLDEFMRVA